MTARDLSDANERQCSRSAKIMMDILLPPFELVHPLPPYPPPWPSLTDEWVSRYGLPLWSAAHTSLSPRTQTTIRRQPDGRFVHEGIEYLTGERFLALLTGDATD